MAETRPADLPPTLADATEHQPRARLALGAALASGPGPRLPVPRPARGRQAAGRARLRGRDPRLRRRDPDDARRRALLDPSPHPDLVWLRPRGAQHLVEEVREQVIRAAAYRPFEGASRVFVIEQAETMREESQNALLKTLEEPPKFDHLLLLSAEPEALLETITSRCQEVAFTALPPEALAEALASEVGPRGSPRRRGSPAATPNGLAFCSGRRGCGCVAKPRRWLGRRATSRPVAPPGGHSWSAPKPQARRPRRPPASASRRGEQGRRPAREIGEEARRVGRRRRTEVLDFGLELCAVWFRDLAAVAAGAPELVLNSDRAEELGR